MNEINKKQCSERVYDSTIWRHFPCKRTAKNKEDGKWYCKIHSPSYIKEKEEKRESKYQKECCKKCKIHIREDYYEYCPFCGTKR